MPGVVKNHQQAVEELDVNGFTVIEGALSPAQVSALNQAVDRFCDEHPEQWVGLCDSQRQAPNVLPWTDEFDFVIEQHRGGWYPDHRGQPANGKVGVPCG